MYNICLCYFFVFWLKLAFIWMSYILSWNLSITEARGSRAAPDTQDLTWLDSIGISSFLWAQSYFLALCQIVCSCNFCFLSSSHFNTRAEVTNRSRIIEQSCIFPNSHYQFFLFSQVCFHNSISIFQEKSLQQKLGQVFWPLFPQ